MDGAELQRYARINYDVALTLSEATKFRQNFLDGFPGIGRWIERQMRNQSGEARSLSGRRRLFLHGPVKAKDLICSPIQGTVADIQKKALGLLPTALLPYDAWIIACVRDEIIVEVDEKHARQVAGVLKSTLEQAGACFLTEVPTIAEVSVGSNWGEREVIITGAEDVLLDDSALHADRKSA
jgi:DNA polymerase I-like protein with 3'-5' exonuclease and polymerase domains